MDKEKQKHQNNIGSLARVKAFALDMDGTVYLGEKLLPGAAELVEYLRQSDKKFIFLTNNSSQSAAYYVEKLNRLGLAVNEADIFTSGEATALYLREAYPDLNKVDLYGTPALEAEFRRFGFVLSGADAGAVVLGFDTTLTYDKLWRLCDAVRSGLPYFATHPDLNCPIEGGMMPDIGAVIAFVAASTGRQPDAVIGKPSPVIVAALERRFGLQAQEIAMAGDRLYTDIALGQEGLFTVLVLSGETRREDLAASAFQPDVVAENLAALLGMLKSKPR